MRPLFLALAVVACSPGDDSSSDDTSDSAAPTCAYERPARPAPEALQAGFARVRIPGPVGSGTAGNNPLGGGGPSSKSPFNSGFPATTSVHGHPEVKALVLSRGEGHEAVFVRVDAIGMFAQLRQEIVGEVSQRMGRDMDHALLVGATHTHAAPGRLLNTGDTEGISFFDIIVGGFFPEFYEAFVMAVADAVEAAYADLEPARVGFGDAYCPDGHTDRRCVDGTGDENGTIPMVAVERDGEPYALLMAYAIHGTIWGIDALTLSQDVSGAIEEAVENRYDSPVEVLMFNSWAADMTVNTPSDTPFDPTAADQGGDIRRARASAWAVADAVSETLEAGLQWDDQPLIETETHRVPIDRELLGYDDETFPYPYGAVYCGPQDLECNEDGSPIDPIDGIDEQCLIQFSEEFPAPLQADITVGRLGDFALVTFPGEATTPLGERIMADIAAAHPETPDVLFLGYAQDYLAYAVQEENWYRGEYEASGSLWGPKQGDYLADAIVRLYDSYATDTCPGEEPDALVPFPYTVEERYEPATPVDPCAIADDVDATYGPADEVVFAVQGGDPWLGAPVFRLLDEEGDPLLRPNGMPVMSDDYTGPVEIAVDPPWSEEGASTRTFTWSWRVPVTPPVQGEGVALSAGSYRVAVTVPTGDGSETCQSAVFEVVGD